jgi:hypothetical protein
MMLQRDGTERICWVTAAELARHLGLHPQTLANWRSQDRRAGRNHAGPGKPVYKRIGAAVRYGLLRDGSPVLMPAGGNSSSTRTIDDSTADPAGGIDKAAISQGRVKEEISTSAVEREHAARLE